MSPGKNLNDFANEARSLGQILQDAQLQLTPKPYTPPWQNLSRRSWAGIVVSSGLLSLGALFWFNALKELTNLRSVVANKEEKEQKAA